MRIFSDGKESNNELGAAKSTWSYTGFKLVFDCQNYNFDNIFKTF